MYKLYKYMYKFADCDLNFCEYITSIHTLPFPLIFILYLLKNTFITYFYTLQ